MNKERVSAGIKILGIYYLFSGLGNLVSLVMSLSFIKGEPHRVATYLGQDNFSLCSITSSAVNQAVNQAAIHQAVGHAVWCAFYFLAALICIKFSSSLIRLFPWPAPIDNGPVA